MSDITVTAANVQVDSDAAITEIVQVGEVVTAGQPLYTNTADGLYYKADADASATAAAAVGVSATGASANGFVVLVRQGLMDLGATLTAGVPYIVSTTAGGIAPASDFAGYSSSFLTHLGYAVSSGSFNVRPFVTGASN